MKRYKQVKTLYYYYTTDGETENGDFGYSTLPPRKRSNVIRCGQPDLIIDYKCRVIRKNQTWKLFTRNEVEKYYPRYIQSKKIVFTAPDIKYCLVRLSNKSGDLDVLYFYNEEDSLSLTKTPGQIFSSVD